MRRAAKVDLNHVEIVKALEAVGCRVLALVPRIKGTPDILVRDSWWRLHLGELKSEDGRLSPEQSEFMKHWPVKLWRTAREAVKAVRG